jgi:hypothetical protein
LERNARILLRLVAVIDRSAAERKHHQHAARKCPEEPEALAMSTHGSSAPEATRSGFRVHIDLSARGPEPAIAAGLRALAPG